MRQLGRFILPIIGLIAAFRLSLGWAQNVPETAALKVIRETAADICTTVATEGSGSSVELTGSAKAKLDGAVAKVANLGVEGAAKYQSEHYKGVLRVDLAQAIKANNDCKLSVFNTLVEKMLPAPSSKVSRLPARAAAHPLSSASKSSDHDFRVSLVGVWQMRTIDVTGSNDCLYHDSDEWIVEGAPNGRIFLRRFLRHDVGSFEHCNQSKPEFTDCISSLELITTPDPSNSTSSIEFDSIADGGDNTGLTRHFVNGDDGQSG